MSIFLPRWLAIYLELTAGNMPASTGKLNIYKFKKLASEYLRNVSGRGK
jgi:hypothetical protein